MKEILTCNEIDGLTQSRILICANFLNAHLNDSTDSHEIAINRLKLAGDIGKEIINKMHERSNCRKNALINKQYELVDTVNIVDKEILDLINNNPEIFLRP
jgi:hypothetical protein